VRNQQYSIVGTPEQLSQLTPLLCELTMRSSIERFTVVGDSTTVNGKPSGVILALDFREKGESRREQIHQEIDILNKIEETGCTVE
jgi:hypothetical protein